MKNRGRPVQRQKGFAMFRIADKSYRINAIIPILLLHFVFQSQRAQAWTDPVPFTAGYDQLVRLASNMNGTVVAIWARGDGTARGIMVKRSTDFGRTWGQANALTPFYVSNWPSIAYVGNNTF